MYMYNFCVLFFFSSRRLHTRCALVTGVQTCALPIFCETFATVSSPDWLIVDRFSSPDWKSVALLSEPLWSTTDTLVGAFSGVARSAPTCVTPAEPLLPACAMPEALRAFAPLWSTVADPVPLCPMTHVLYTPALATSSPR